jgi:adenine-specific DNA-methyltransferase
MNKLKMITPDLTDKNIEQIGALFPSVITEIRDENGAVKKAVDFDLLKQALSKNLVEDDNERYRLDWPGKKASLLKANTPITKTLRPCREESVNFDTTENLYIEGDNFEVLKVLQESYLGKIKMIYIDPPYNTGNDFIYKDNFAKSKGEYEEELGITDEEGGKLFRNTDSNGRYHSDWLSMMYERLVVARDLLKDDGVIFISIDDNEVHNLRKICDEVFGEENFINCIAVKMSEASGVKMNHQKVRYPKIKEYILFYKKQSFKNFSYIDKYKIDQWDKENNLLIENLTEPMRKKLIEFEEKDVLSSKDIEEVNSIFLDCKIKSLNDALKEKNIDDNAVENWKFENSYKIIKTAGSSSVANMVKKSETTPKSDVAAILSPDGLLYYYITSFNREAKTPRIQVIFADSNIYKNPCDFWQDIKTTGGIAGEGGVKYNNGKKPLKLLLRLIKMTTEKDDLILDFFSGSSSTAHAILQQNAEDWGGRKFIMVQLPEDLNESLIKATGDTKKTIEEVIEFLTEINKPLILSELGKERIRRAGKKIVEELNAKNQQLKLGEDPVDANKLDIGFRVYKTDSTNMKDVFYHPSELKQHLLPGLESNIKEDRKAEDLLTQVILDLGLELTLPIETKQILGNTIFIVQTNALVACFDKDIDFNIVDTISDLKPLKVVFKDASFKDDKDRINVEERFKRLSPETKVTVI